MKLPLSSDKRWILKPATVGEPYIPDAQEIAEMKALKDLQSVCLHTNYNEEDGCLDCGYNAK